MRCESSGWFASISNGLTGLVTVQRASVTRCPASGGAPFLTGRFRHSISGRMIFVGATRSAKVGVSVRLRAIPGKLVTQVPPGVSSARWRRICFPRPASGQRYIGLRWSTVFQGRRRGRVAGRQLPFSREPCSRSVFLHCDVANLTNRLARVSKDYAPDQRAAKRPDEFELIIVTAVLLETASNPCYVRLRIRPSLFGKSGSYQGIGCCKLSACLAWGD